jgi:O-6-methylguanine DNA methyltransferase
VTKTDATPGVTFRARVLAVVRRIPPGRVATYGDVADLAGQPRAARAVGNIMRQCGVGVPAHRVVAAGGKLGGYGGSEHLKRSLLVAEGVTLRGSRIPLEQFQWTPKRRASGAKRSGRS